MGKITRETWEDCLKVMENYGTLELNSARACLKKALVQRTMAKPGNQRLMAYLTVKNEG